MILNEEQEPKEVKEEYSSQTSILVEDSSENQTEKDYQALDIPDSLRFLALFDSAVKNQEFTLHKWQAEVNEDISLGRTRRGNTITGAHKPTSIHPYKYCLCAANGSGKDAFVIAPLALWFITTKIQSKVIITSASGTQLTTQTEAYISNLAKQINLWTLKRLGTEILKINKRHIFCKLSGSVIHLFATDEGEKAEGHHPLVPTGEMMIIVNEAKSVSQEIFDALRRCTGYNYWINVSSPGEPNGNFYKSFNSWPNSRRVSYFDCPHQSPDEFEQDRKDLGEYSPLFRSKWLALFTYIGGSYVVSRERLDKLRNDIRENKIPKTLQTREIRIGLDIALSNNGDETTISVFKGNDQRAQTTFKIQDATILADYIEVELLKHVKKEHKFIYADDGGVGRAVIDILNSRGWKIIRVLNNSAAKNKKQFRNRGAQLWYKFSRLVELGLIILLDDNKLYEQISSRKYKVAKEGTTLDKLQLQSKRDMISQGLTSPDRADACVLAFTDSNLNEFIEGHEMVISKAPNDPTIDTKKLSIEEIRMMLRRGRAKVQEERFKRCGMSQSSALKQLHPKQHPFQRN